MLIKSMTDNSQNSELLVESQEANTKIPEKEEAVHGEDDITAQNFLCQVKFFEHFWSPS